MADYRTVLGQVDAVDVLTPTPQHAEVCAAALDAGRDVFCEKPLTLSPAEASQLAEQVAKTGCVFQVGYYFRRASPRATSGRCAISPAPSRASSGRAPTSASRPAMRSTSSTISTG